MRVIGQNPTKNLQKLFLGANNEAGRPHVARLENDIVKVYCRECDMYSKSKR